MDPSVVDEFEDGRYGDNGERDECHCGMWNDQLRSHINAFDSRRAPVLVLILTSSIVCTRMSAHALSPGSQGTHLAKGVQALEGAHESVPSHLVGCQPSTSMLVVISGRERPSPIMLRSLYSWRAGSGSERNADTKLERELHQLHEFLATQEMKT